MTGSADTAHAAPRPQDLAALRVQLALEADPRPGTRPLRDTALATFGIELVVADAARTNMVVVRMAPTFAGAAGALHVLAESAASTAAGLAAGPGRRAFGAELNAATLAAPALSGPVLAVAEPVRLERDLHTWRIRVFDADDALVLDARCTLSVVAAPTTR